MYGENAIMLHSNNDKGSDTGNQTVYILSRIDSVAKLAHEVFRPAQTICHLIMYENALRMYLFGYGLFG